MHLLRRQTERLVYLAKSQSQHFIPSSRKRLADWLVNCVNLWQPLKCRAWQKENTIVCECWSMNNKASTILEALYIIIIIIIIVSCETTRERRTTRHPFNPFIMIIDRRILFRALPLSLLERSHALDSQISFMIAGFYPFQVLTRRHSIDPSEQKKGKE